MKVFELCLPHGYLLHGCLYTIANWHQIVQVKALQAIQLVDCVWNTRGWHMSSRTGIFEQEMRCSCIGAALNQGLCGSESATAVDHPQLDKFAGSGG